MRNVASRMDPYRFYLGARTWFGFCWTTMVTVNLVYMVEVAGLGPLQMVLVGTVLELSAFIFEIPTGVLADRYSRRLSVIVGNTMTGASFILIALVPTFEAILVAQFIWGVGYTFISGAYPAWLSEEIGAERANRAIVKSAQFAQAAGFFGIIFAVLLAHVSLHLPMLIGGMGVVGLAVAMAIWMTETGYQPRDTQPRAAWYALGATFMDGVREVRSRPLLLTILSIAVVFGLFSEGLDRLYVPYLIESFTFPELGQLDSVVWWGVIAAVSSIVGFLATGFARRVLDLSNHLHLTAALASITLVISLAVLAFANLDGFYVVLACFWLVNGLRAAAGPLETAWLNRRLPSSIRATILSMHGQADSLGQAFGGPIVGLIAQRFAIGTALTISALLLLPALAMYQRAAKLNDDRDDREVLD
jgi:DHA3 family tetracycline resistance protein-like MFS transporter